jgi:ribonuclease BN (tRNA processing enzyme)
MGRLYLRQMRLGPMQNFVYLVGDRDEHRAVAIDPAWEIDRILEQLAADEMTLEAALVTHFHPDHIGGDLMGHHIPGPVELLERGQKIKVYVHKSEKDYVPRISGLSPSDLVARESGDEMTIGDQRAVLPGRRQPDRRRHAVRRRLRTRRPAGQRSDADVRQPDQQAARPARRDGALPRSRLRRPPDVDDR